MEEITSKENMLLAYKRVRENRGAPGIDGITTEDFPEHLKTHWPTIHEQLLQDHYKPQPVRRVPIPKPDGGIRELGIPTTTDRLIQQAILQVLTPIFDPAFSESSYGFRPERNAHQAVRKAREYINAGYTTIVDLDLEKFFDTVNHDRLMARLARTIEDKRLLKLIRRYLQAGIIMDNGVCVRTTVGTPQGGPLSPLLANILLDEMDKELEKRGHRFCRYADDCNIYVKTPRAGERVMQSLTGFIETKLKLKVNQDKSSVDRPTRRKFLGFSFYWNKAGAQIRIADKAKKRLTDKVRALTQRRVGVSIEQRIERINQYLSGWLNYFRLANAGAFLEATDEHIRSRLRMCIWKQWRLPRTRYRNLRKFGLSHTNAIKYANTRKGYWRIAGSQVLKVTMTNQYFKNKLELFSLAEAYHELRLN
jgi:group II intron reverse transcriptase/maturase